MPLLNGLEAARQMSAWERPPEVILLTVHAEDRYVLEALRAGVRGYVLKKQAALVAEGKTIKEIAVLLGVSVKTADAHRTRLMQKLDIHDIAGLTRTISGRASSSPDRRLDLA